MKTILIAGAGNIGSRHLQGTTTSKQDLDIWVFDLSEESLRIAKERFEQMPNSGKKKAHFVTNLRETPEQIDVAIVATGSKPRAAIVKDLLELKQVRYMVLEKFLFGSMSEYHEIGSLLKEKGVLTWVNCPFRLYEGYNILKGMFDHTQPIIASYGNGGDWGLCCNSIHYIDIFMYLTGCNDYSLDISGLEPTVIDSKRPGYIELVGNLVVKTKNGDKLTLKTSLEGSVESIIHFANGQHLAEADEINNTLVFDGKEIPLGFKYQSSLTGSVIDDLLINNKCGLSTFDNSAKYHLRFLSEIIPFVNKIKGWDSDSCPIT